MLHIERITKGLIYTTSDHRAYLVINASIVYMNATVKLTFLNFLNFHYLIKDKLKNELRDSISKNTVYLLKNSILTIYLIWKYLYQ